MEYQLFFSRVDTYSTYFHQRTFRLELFRRLFIAARTHICRVELHRVLIYIFLFIFSASTISAPPQSYLTNQMLALKHSSHVKAEKFITGGVFFESLS